MTILRSLLADLVAIDDVLFVVKSGGATSEIRTRLSIREHDKWITLGDNKGPCHMHVDSTSIKNIRFVKEEKPERTSFSVRFFDDGDRRVLAAFFTGMYDDGHIIKRRVDAYEQLRAKYETREGHGTDIPVAGTLGRP